MGSGPQWAYSLYSAAYTAAYNAAYIHNITLPPRINYNVTRKCGLCMKIF